MLKIWRKICARLLQILSQKPFFLEESRVQWEKPVLRYYLKDVWADTENVRITKKAEAAYGKDPKETAVGTAALTVEKPDAALTFLNEKARYDKFSHTDCIKNTIPLLFS